MARVGVKTTDADRGLVKASLRLAKGRLVQDAALLAQQLIEFAVASPIPRETGDLAGSDSVEVNQQKGRVTFGFNKVYAAFQDQPKQQTGFVVVRPRAKKALYIPLSLRGKKHRYGNNPTLEGLEWGVDYVLRSEVRIPIKPYGHELGPNHYFSQTVKNRTKWFYETLAKRMKGRLEKK